MKMQEHVVRTRVVSEAKVARIAEAAWQVLNFDNDPHDGQPHNTANWVKLNNAIRRALSANNGDGKHG